MGGAQCLLVSPLLAPRWLRLPPHHSPRSHNGLFVTDYAFDPNEVGRDEAEVLPCGHPATAAASAKPPSEPAKPPLAPPLPNDPPGAQVALYVPEQNHPDFGVVRAMVRDSTDTLTNGTDIPM